MINFLKLEDFLRTSNPDNKFKIKGMTAKAFGLAEETKPSLVKKIKKFIPIRFRELTKQEQIETAVFNIHEEWLEDYAKEIKVPYYNQKRSIRQERPYYDEHVVLSYLAGNITPNGNKVFYIGFGSGLWAYSCASLTKKETIAVDPSDIAYSSAQKIQKRFGDLPNLKYRKAKLADITSEIEEGDTIFTATLGDITDGLKQLKKEFLELIKSGNINGLFSVSYSCCCWGSPLSQTQVETKLDESGIKSADVSLANILSRAYVLVKSE